MMRKTWQEKKVQWKIFQEKGRGTRDEIANICNIIEKKQEGPRKTFISTLLTMPKPLTMWITTNWKIL